MGNLTVFYLLSSQKAKDKCITNSMLKICLNILCLKILNNSHIFGIGNATNINQIIVYNQVTVNSAVCI